MGIVTSRRIKFMKKFISVFVIVVLMGAAAFAIETSAGGGVKYTNTMSNLEASESPVTIEISSAMSEVAIYGFFDAKYIQIDLGYSMITGGSLKESLDGMGPLDFSNSADFKGSGSYLTLGVLGKYPIQVGSVTLFPLLGMESKLNLTLKDEDGNDVKKDMTSSEKSNLNQLWFKAGIGADLNITPKVYVRPSILFGTKLKNSEEKDSIAEMEDMGSDVKFNVFRLDIGAAVGFKL